MLFLFNLVILVVFYIMAVEALVISYLYILNIMFGVISAIIPIHVFTRFMQAVAEVWIFCGMLYTFFTKRHILSNFPVVSFIFLIDTTLFEFLFENLNILIPVKAFWDTSTIFFTFYFILGGGFLICGFLYFTYIEQVIKMQVIQPLGIFLYSLEVTEKLLPIELQNIRNVNFLKLNTLVVSAIRYNQLISFEIPLLILFYWYNTELLNYLQVVKIEFPNNLDTVGLFFNNLDFIILPDNNKYHLFFNFTSFGKIFIVGLLIFIMYYFFNFLKKIVITEGILMFELPFLLNFSFLILLLSLFTTNLLILLILMEIFVYILYILLPLKKTFNYNIKLQTLILKYNNFAIEAAMKYFLLGTVNSLFLICAIILLLIGNFDLNFYTIQYYLFVMNFISTNWEYSIYFFYATCLILIFFLFKLSIFPFHWWLPDVFQGAAYYIIFFIALPVKIIIIFIMLVLFTHTFQPIISFLQPILGILAILTMFIGSFGMLFQINIKRFLAYSTLNHMGYILIGFSLNSSLSIFAIILYLFGYILMMLLFFIILGGIFDKKENSIVLYLSQLIYLKQNFLVLWCFIFNLFSMLGLPPLAGFWGKYYLLLCLFNHLDNALYFILFIAIILTSIIAAAAYLNIIKLIFFTNKIANTNIVILQYNILDYFYLFSLQVIFLFFWICWYYENYIFEFFNQIYLTLLN